MFIKNNISNYENKFCEMICLGYVLSIYCSDFYFILFFGEKEYRPFYSHPISLTLQRCVGSGHFYFIYKVCKHQATVCCCVVIDLKLKQNCFSPMPFGEKICYYFCCVHLARFFFPAN